MADSTTFGTVPDGAEVLAETGGYQYLAVAWVYRRRPAGEIEYYATVAAWPDTPVAQLARKDDEIAVLQARIAELEAQLTNPAPTDAPAAEPLEVCGIDGCTVEKPAGRSIQMHRTRMHRSSPDTDGWHCRVCQSDAHAPGLEDVTICMRCEQAAKSTTNGVHA